MIVHTCCNKYIFEKRKKTLQKTQTMAMLRLTHGCCINFRTNVAITTKLCHEELMRAHLND